MSPTKSQTTADAELEARGHRSVTVGATLGRYRLLRVLGEGGMGTVYEAVHEDLGRRVALKTLLPALAERPLARERFFREARAASRVRHPGVVQVHDADVDEGTVYLVMDLLEGETLSRRMSRGPLSAEALLALMELALDGLACAHDAGVVHRDLKPSNILVVRAPEGERAVLLDFGVSRLVDEESDLTGSTAVLGTPAYMSPEQARGARDVEAVSDQFSMGAVLYHALSGRRPFEGAGALELAWSIQHDRKERLATLCPGAPKQVVAAIERAMSTDPTARFSSVRALHEALRAPATPPRRVRRFAPGAVVALLLATGAWVSTRQPQIAVSPRRSIVASAPASLPSPPVVTTAPTIVRAPTISAPAPAQPVARPHAPRASSVRIAPRAHVATSPAPPVAATPEPLAAPEPAESTRPSMDISVRGRNRALILGR